MRLDQIGLLRSAGTISYARILPGETPGKWMIECKRKNGETIALTAQRDNIRQFASLDSAWRVLASLGFREAKIDWHKMQQEESER